MAMICVRHALASWIAIPFPPFDQARTPPDQSGKVTDEWHGGISNGRINDVLATRRYASGDDLKQILKLLACLHNYTRSNTPQTVKTLVTVVGD